MATIINEKGYEDWRPAIQGIARQFVGSGMDVEDLIAEGYHGLHEANISYSPGKKCSFERFAKICIHRKIRDAAEKWKQLTPVEDDEMEYLTAPLTHSTENVNLNAMHTLSDKEFRVVMYYYGFCCGESMTLREISDVMNLSIERIRQIRNSALGKMRKAA